MPDPLSITTAVAGLLKASYEVGVELKKFKAGVTVVRTTIDRLIKDVEGLQLVLESMRDTFANVTAEFGTGNVASHWQNIAQALEDGNGILRQLQECVQEVNKTARLLDGPRKQLRLNLAADQIALYHQHIKSYRDTLQLSLQTIMLWNQVSYNKSSERILPTITDLQREVRQLAVSMNERIETLQEAVATKHQEA